MQSKYQRWRKNLQGYFQLIFSPQGFAKAHQLYKSHLASGFLRSLEDPVVCLPVGLAMPVGFLKLTVGNSRGILWIKTGRPPWGFWRAQLWLLCWGYVMAWVTWVCAGRRQPSKWDCEVNAADLPRTSCTCSWALSCSGEVGLLRSHCYLAPFESCLGLSFIFYVLWLSIISRNGCVWGWEGWLSSEQCLGMTSGTSP